MNNWAVYLLECSGKIIYLLRDAIIDSYDIDWGNVVIARLEEMFGEKNER